MSVTGRCVFRCLNPGHINPGVLRTCAARSLSLTPGLRAEQRRSPGSTNKEEGLSQPIKFSTSKASHRTWNVASSMGGRFQRPWWKVLPLSLFAIGFLLWCVFRPESEVDRTLDKQLYEHLPSLLTNMEEEEDEEEEEETQKLKNETDNSSK